MIIDTATLQKHFDAITKECKIINALSNKDPKTAWADLMEAQVELRRLYERLGQVVFRAYIDNEHAEKMAQLADLILGKESAGGGS
jgi:hypothetical protein